MRGRIRRKPDHRVTPLRELQIRRLVASVIVSVALTGIVGASAAPPALAAPTAETTAAAISAHAAKGVILPVDIVGQAVIRNGTVDGHFAGTFTATGFSTTDGQLFVTGVVAGTFISTTGHIRKHVTAVTTDPIKGVGMRLGLCDIRTFALASLDLEQPGLDVQLPNAPSLTIIAWPGPGNALGDLFCSGAYLLSPSELPALVALLNELFVL